MSTDPSHTVWDDEEAARQAALAEGALVDEQEPGAEADADDS